MSKIIIAHPGKQHSFQTATALEMSDNLYAYITTIYDKPNSFTNILNKILSGDTKKKGRGRRCDTIPDEKVIQFCELRSLFNLLLQKLPMSWRIKCWYNDFLADAFGRKVAKHAIRNHVNMVIMYDCTATKCFEILKKKAPEIKRILDVSIAHRAFMRDVYEKDMAVTGDTALKEAFPFLWNEKNMDRYKQEAYDADFFFAPSKIVKNSLEYIGVSPEKVFLVPYGVDITKFTTKPFSGEKEIEKVLRLIYVGQINYRKGIHHLLSAITELPQDVSVELTLVGSYNCKLKMFQENKDKGNIHFEGFVTSDLLEEKYQQADLFVFPTIGEGFGLVVLEAMACGLPVLCSIYAGGNDAIIDGWNGFVIDPQDEKSLRDYLIYLAHNKDKLGEMGRNARAEAEKYTWDKYYFGVNEALSHIMPRMGER